MEPSKTGGAGQVVFTLVKPELSKWPYSTFVVTCPTWRNHLYARLYWVGGSTVKKPLLKAGPLRVRPHLLKIFGSPWRKLAAGAQRWAGECPSPDCALEKRDSLLFHLSEKVDCLLFYPAPGADTRVCPYAYGIVPDSACRLKPRLCGVPLTSQSRHRQGAVIQPGWTDIKLLITKLP